MIAVWFKRPGQPDVKMLFDKMPSDEQITAMQEFVTAVENGKAAKNHRRDIFTNPKALPSFVDRR